MRAKLAREDAMSEYLRQTDSGCSLCRHPIQARPSVESGGSRGAGLAA